jgi:hypothetical protein
MPRYCDSDNLEKNWFNWLLSSRTPKLERYRQLGLLWTKVIGVSTDKNGIPIKRNGKNLPDPSSPDRTHCVALSTPIYFDSHSGEPQEFGSVFIGSKHFHQSLSSIDSELNLVSDSPLHQLNNLFHQQAVVVPSLRNDGYINEPPTSVSWHLMLEDVNKICAGIAIRFKPRTEEEHQELTNDAVLQVINKLATYKLVYKPGLAPVFNLFTTTIHRIMYSIMNKRKNQREGIDRILSEASSGVLPSNTRSLRVHRHKNK